MEAPEKHFRVAGREIGEGCEPYLVAEMACAHQGRAEIALAMVDIAADAKVDALQIQLFSADRLISRKHPNFELMQGLTIETSAWEAVIDRARARSLPIWANVFSKEDLEFAVSAGASAIKLHSTDLSNPELLARAAATGLPTTLSVSASTMSEIETAIDVMRRSGSAPALLMHGFQAFPTPIEQNHLRFIETLKKAFGLPVGFQDHAAGGDPFACILPLMALAAGAALVEKHFTYAEGLSNIDHQSSLDPNGLRDFVGLFRRAASALGSPEEHALSSLELEYRNRMKKCLVAARHLQPGHRLRSEDVVFLRATQPLLMPDQLAEWLGKPLRLPVEAGEPLSPEHFEENPR